MNPPTETPKMSTAEFFREYCRIQMPDGSLVKPQVRDIDHIADELMEAVKQAEAEGKKLIIDIGRRRAGPIHSNMMEETEGINYYFNATTTVYSGAYTMAQASKFLEEPDSDTRYRPRRDTSTRKELSTKEVARRKKKTKMQRQSRRRNK